MKNYIPVIALCCTIALSAIGATWVVSNKISDGDKELSGQISELTGEVQYIKGRIDGTPKYAGGTP